jgi:hypothetical protein
MIFIFLRLLSEAFAVVIWYLTRLEAFFKREEVIGLESIDLEGIDLKGVYKIERLAIFK